MIKYISFIPNGGMWHMLISIAGCLKIAENSNRVLLLDRLLEHPHFACNFNDIFDVYHDQISLDNKDADKAKEIYIPYMNLPNKLNKIDKFKNTFLPRQIVNADISLSEYENYIYNDLNEYPVIAVARSANVSRYDLKHLLWHIKIKPKCISYVRELYNQLPNQYIGAHFRNTDYKNDIDEFINRVQKKANISQCKNVFLATDDISSISYIEFFLKDISLYYNKQLNVDWRNEGTRNLHLTSSAAWENVGLTKWHQHAFFLAEMYCLLRAKIFIGSKGNLANIIPMFKQENLLFEWFFNC